jgi:small subunit ribosomal protein S17
MSDETNDAAPVEAAAPAAPVAAVRAVKAKPKPKAEAAPAPRAVSRENARKVREGLVVSNGSNKTAVVEVTTRVRHPRYSKTLQRSTKLHVHDEENTLRVGDRVRVQETRPLSKLKRWRLVEILERAK